MKNGETGARGNGLGRLFRCLLLKLIEDLSNRELKKGIIQALFKPNSHKLKEFPNRKDEVVSFAFQQPH